MASAVWQLRLEVPAHVALATYTGVMLGSSSGLVPDLNSEWPPLLPLLTGTAFFMLGSGINIRRTDTVE